jgi:hypothetical protein
MLNHQIIQNIITLRSKNSWIYSRVVLYYRLYNNDEITSVYNKLGNFSASTRSFTEMGYPWNHWWKHTAYNGYHDSSRSSVKMLPYFFLIVLSNVRLSSGGVALSHPGSTMLFIYLNYSWISGSKIVKCSTPTLFPLCMIHAMILHFFSLSCKQMFS